MVETSQTHSFTKRKSESGLGLVEGPDFRQKMRRDMPQCKEEPTEFDGYASRYHDLRSCSTGSGRNAITYYDEYKVRHISCDLRVRARASPARILDYGCGIGNSAPHLSRHFPGALIVGVDMSSTSIEHARAQCRCLDRVSFAHLGDRAFAGGELFDLALISNVLHHAAPSTHSGIISLVKSRLAPGGHLYIFEHNPLNPLTRLAVHRCPFNANAILLLARQACSLLVGSGFEEVVIQYTLFSPACLRFLGFIERYLHGFPFGAQYCARATAPRPA
jgi:SAM-dependent methyltransferase